MKKVLLSLAGLGTALAVMPMFAAFEAHVVNVTATIENALSVPVKYIEFGTVFPQEQLDQQFGMRLSGSFMDDTQNRVDTVNYFIRQKPKCAITSNDGTTFDATVGNDGAHAYTGTGHIEVVNVGTEGEPKYETRINCGEAPRDLAQGEAWGVLPNLCPYLSKHPITNENDPVENDNFTPAFHQPYTILSDGSIDWTDTDGKLYKYSDVSDTWNIDLKVPCFGGYCAQDWEEFVSGINEDANPASYTQPIENEHKVFGCDLWVEVSGVTDTVEPTPTPEVTPIPEA